MKHSIPLHLQYFEVLTPDTTVEQVKQDFQDMMDLELKNEQYFFNSQQYEDLVEELLTGEITLQGNGNAWGRKHGIMMKHQASYQSYNADEMFRNNIVNKTYGYVQQVALFRTFETFDEIPEDLKKVKKKYKELYPYLKYPSHEQFRITDYIIRHKKRITATKPGASHAISLWSGDGHYCQLENHIDEGYFILKVKLPSAQQMVSLKFTLPKSSRFLTGKISKPTITRDDQGEVKFCFSIIHDVEEQEFKNFVTVDINRVDQFTATVFYPETMEHSAPYHPNHKIQQLEKSIKKKYELANHLLECMEECERSNQPYKGLVLARERQRVLASAARLKDERSTQVAVQLHQIALAHDAYIVFEDLRWVGNKSGKWDRNEVQEKTEHLASSSGIQTKRVSAKNTSQECPNCHSEMKHRKRRNYCKNCDTSLDRDVSATRVMGVRKLKIDSFLQLKQAKSAHTRVSYSSTLLQAGHEPESQVTLDQGAKTAILLNTNNQVLLL